MKRLYFCAAIAAAAILLVFGSGALVEGFSDSLCRQLDSTAAAVQQDQLPRAAQLLEQALEQYRHTEHVLAIFIRRESLSRLDETLQAACSYAQNGNAEETLAELARAQSQLYAVRHLFFSVL